MSSSYHNGHLYLRLGRITLFFLFSLILIGGIVRTTGAGMGCPDWPKCFGSWVPPTDVSQLPVHYQDIYKDRGYASMEFNVVKTWTEYFNRLFGALTGLFVFATFIASIPYFKKDKTVAYLSCSAFLLVCFEGWLGARVVASNLAHQMITVHLLFAFLIVALVIYSLVRAQNLEGKNQEKQAYNFGKYTPVLVITALIITLCQIITGTFVRQEVTELSHVLPTAENWLVNSSATLPFHRSLAWLVIASNALLIYKIFKDLRHNNVLFWAAIGIGLVILSQIFTGILLTYFGFPAVAQTLHILLAAVLFGLQIFILSTISVLSHEVDRKNVRLEFSLISK